MYKSCNTSDSPDVIIRFFVNLIATINMLDIYKCKLTRYKRKFLKSNYVKCATDHTIMPFGRLVKESLESGLNTLFDIKDLVLALYEAKQALTNVLGKFFPLSIVSFFPQFLSYYSDTNRMQWFLEQTMSLTFEFNKSIPNQGKRIERIKLLSDLAEIENKIQQTRDLIKLEFANNLLLAAQYRINDANPIDYIYKVII